MDLGVLALREYFIIPQISKTEASPSNGLLSYLEHSLGSGGRGFYRFAEMQLQSTGLLCILVSLFKGIPIFVGH